MFFIFPASTVPIGFNTFRFPMLLLLKTFTIALDAPTCPNGPLLSEPVPVDTIPSRKPMVRKSHFWPQTSHLVPVVLPQNPPNLQKINILSWFRLSPQFSPLFPCTRCGKPVPSYRRFWLLSVVTPGHPTFQLRLTARLLEPPPWLERLPEGCQNRTAQAHDNKSGSIWNVSRDLGG